MMWLVGFCTFECFFKSGKDAPLRAISLNTFYKGDDPQGTFTQNFIKKILDNTLAKFQTVISEKFGVTSSNT
jgi:hypothetical protein